MGNRLRVAALVLVLASHGASAGAQETRGNISGTVQDKDGVLPGASVRIVNVDTGVPQTVIANNRGYFEAPLLLAGNYEITVEMPGFRTLKRAGLVLSNGQHLSLPLTLEVGTVAETITITDVAPLLETTTTRVGTNFTERQLQDLPFMSNMPMVLARFAPGLNASSFVQWAGQGAIGDPSNMAQPVGGVGGNEWTIDGATNNGSNRFYATSPNTDMLQEMRVEAASFTATAGHGTGVGISMTTRSGSNSFRGTTNYQYWTNRLNAPNPYQKAVLDADPLAKAAYDDGYSHNISQTFGGPIRRDRLFVFLNYSYSNDNFNGKNASRRTVPSARQLEGDFSDLLLLPNPAQYQIYDPLTTRPDPARPGHVIRDPFPGNIVPKNRITNPLYALYAGLLPPPNVDFGPGQEPINNFYSAAEPTPLRNHVWGARIDFNPSEQDRFFIRHSGSTFTSEITDWTYLNQPGLHALGRLRTTTSNTGTWTRVFGATVLNGQLAYNRFLETDRRLGQKKYTPGKVGLPSYMDDFCTARGNFGNTPACSLPVMNITGYTAISNAAGTYDQVKNYQGQLSVSHLRGAHTLKAGLDVRRHVRERNDPGNASGNFTFNNTYTRKADDTTVSPAGNLGLSWAAFMMGLPTTVQVENTPKFTVTSPWYGLYVEDRWRVARNLTVTAGLRYEYEDGIVEDNNAMLVGFAPDETVSISAAAEAAYAAAPIAQRPASTFKVRGGSVFASGEGRSWAGEGMWMPRVSGAYSLNDKTVLKGGYGMFYDTLNATSFTPNQTGYSQTTTSNLSVDFGRTFLLGNPHAGISPMGDPFPVTSAGTRFQPVVGNSLGLDAVVGSALSAPNRATQHARVQRWRVSLQRALSPNITVEVAYNGSVGDRLSTAIRQDYLPEEWFSSSNVRDLTQQTLLNANVTNPFAIGNFASLQSTNPVLYNRMAGNPFFTSPTVQRHRLLRDFPHINNLTYNLPLGKNRAHSAELSLDRRFANGISGNVTYTATRLEELTTVEEYDRTPWLWQPGNDARPHRLVATFTYELPFGTSRRYLNSGGWLAAVVGGWQTSGNFEYQPGALLNWGNVFFYGRLEDIPVDNPTLDRWFNVDAGFERDPAKIPANFQKRVFPFRVDGVRAPDLKQLNINIARTVGLGSRRSLQFRVDIINALNRTTYANPNLNPQSTQFGQITAATLGMMRFVTFVTKYNF